MSGTATVSIPALAKVKKIKIMCLGDSLTAGHYDYGMRYHPYCNKLAKLLNHESSTLVKDPATLRYECDEYGVDGEDTHTMLLRLRDQFTLARSSDKAAASSSNIEDDFEQQSYMDMHAYKLPAQVARHAAEIADY